MSRLIRSTAFLVALVLSLAACDSAGLDAGLEATPGAATAAASAPAPSPTTPHLSFTSEAAFGDAYNNAAKLSADQASTSRTENGFVSMAAAEIADIEALERGEITEDDVRQSSIEDPYLAALVSPTGVLQIGSSVYKVGATTVFRGTDKDLEAFNTKTEAELATARSHEAAPIDRSGGVTEASALNARCSSSFTGNNGKKYKVCGTSFITNWPWIIHSAGASTKILKKWWFLYLPTRGDYLYLQSTHRLIAGAGPLPNPTTVTASTTNSYVLIRIFKFAVGGADFRGTINSTHRGTQSGVTAQTTTSVSLP